MISYMKPKINITDNSSEFTKNILSEINFRKLTIRKVIISKFYDNKSDKHEELTDNLLLTFI